MLDCLHCAMILVTYFPVLVFQLVSYGNAAVLQLVSSTCCPYLFSQVGSECFYLSEGIKSWGFARRFCQKMGGDLAVPSNVTALDAFVFPAAGTPGVWIGGTDQSNEGDWAYLNGDPILPGDWSAGQPDNYGGAEHCLELRSYFDPPVNDYLCFVWQQFVCEVPCAVTCPPPSVNIGQECFYLCSIKLRWNDARKFCLQMGADLAVPADVLALDAFVFSKAKGYGVWIGGTDQEAEGIWTFINGDAIQDGDWAATQPDNFLGQEDCLEIRSYFNPPLNDYRCYRRQEFVCEFEPV
ncbi:galactose-specific lectin nattectin-like [Penaeus japonicus]|uniref:galactose-specific lectin nattectin-like n=1 Tax=Penaeus japonicus TaxID=27405 RepID=UPI001C711AF8|nr:galactose-specific lectin nattectin-like [Penaeus japonicus]